MRRRRTLDLDGNTSRLTELGLTLTEARCYVALLEIAPATAGQLAEHADVPRPKVYGTVKSLEQRGFAYSSGDPVTTFRAVDPELALGEWTRRREHERRLLDERDQQLRGELVAELPHPSEHATEKVGEIMQLAGGSRAATADTLARLMDRAEQRLDIVVSRPVFRPMANWSRSEKAALERGVQVRMLVSSRELAIELGCEEILAAGGEVRLARNTPSKLVVRDNGAEAIVALPTPGDTSLPTCVVIQHSELVAPMQLLFNREWRRARPLVLQAPASGRGRGRPAAS